MPAFFKTITTGDQRMDRRTLSISVKVSKPPAGSAGPGFEKSDFRVDLEENLLTITGREGRKSK